MLTKKAYFFPILILLVLLVLLFIENLRQELKLPSPGWSRSYNLNEKAVYPVKPYVRDSSIYFAGDSSVTKVECGDTLKCTKNKISGISLSGNSEFWAKDQKVIYQDNDSLYVFDGKKAEEKEKGITSARIEKDWIVFWKENELYVFDPVKETSKLVKKFNQNIMDTAIEEHSFMTASVDSGKFQFNYFEKQGKGYKSTSLPLVSLVNNESLEGLNYFRSGSELHILLNTMRMSQGNKNYDLYEMVMNPADMKAPVQMKKIELRDAKTDEAYPNPRNINFRQTGKGENILFSEYGRRTSKNEGYNLYEAVKKNGKWEAERISTTRDLPVNSSWLGNDLAVWTAFSGKEYTLHAASTLPMAIEKSRQVSKEDLKYAASNTVTVLFGSFIFLLFAMMWVILPTIYFAVLFFSKGNLFEDESKQWIVLVPAVLLTVSQLYTFNTSFRAENFVVAPGYLTFPGSFIIWPILIALLSWGILKLSKINDVNPPGKFFYFAVMDVLFLMFLLGPYIL
ncbi:hypothetical protein [Peribacillus kribbensis]|uniref:hypothetical protein n=1 Tax=Peribacillus kribbensis TaxID=356658 RepID=UPI0004164027|nr:hypothetical protein [Peribacillus kribbensis]